jgi:hypothetical protein
VVFPLSTTADLHVRLTDGVHSRPVTANHATTMTYFVRRPDGTGAMRNVAERLFIRLLMR